MVLTSTKLRIRLALLIGAWGLGCEPTQRAQHRAGPADWAGTERDSAGVRIVENPASGIWTEATQWTVEKDLSIGVVDGPQEYQFGHVVDADAGADGRIYVLDQQAARIRVFGPDGTHIRSFGRVGQGPGELSNNIPRGAQAVLMTPTGGLLVPDRENSRATRFDANGEFAGSFALRPEEGEPLSLSVLPTGDFLLHRSAPTFNGLLRLGQKGEVLDTVLAFGVRASPPDPQGRVAALTHAPLWSITSDGRLISGMSDRSRIEVRRSNGDLEMAIVKDDANAVLSRQEQERFLERLLELWAEMFRTRGDSEDWIQSQLRRGRSIYILPDRLPAFTALTGGPEGTIWARGVLPVDSMTREIVTHASPLRALASTNWDVYASDGRFLGDVGLPSRFTLFRIRGEHIYGMERDSLGVQRVVRLRIVVR